MTSFLVIVTVFLSTQSHLPNTPNSIQSLLSADNESILEVDCHKPKILRLVDDVAVSSSIEIRSEELTLIGSNSRLLFQRDIEPSSAPSSWSRNEASPKPEQKPTPKVRNDGLSGAEFMFNVLNSTFSVSGVHAILNSERSGVCYVTGSTVHFSSSSITSTGDLSPFMVRMSRNEGKTLGSAIILTDVTHHSKSDHIAPFVGLIHPQSPLVSSPAIEKGDAVTGQAECITIVGTGLSLESKHLIGETGPLFSFDLTEQSSSLAASGYEMQIETSLLESTLVNVSSSSPFTPNKQSFGSEVTQLVVGSCVSCCTNHDSGTGMMSPNMGGNVVCLNTSFSSCIRLSNTEYDFTFENRTQTELGRLNNVTSDVTSVSFTLCTFNEMTVAAGSSYGGTAIFLWHTLSSLTVKTCFFHKCSCTASGDDGGAINFYCSSSNRRPFSVSDSSFTECSANDCGGSLLANEASSISIVSSFFELSSANRYGAVFLMSNDITISNTAFVECSATHSAGAVYINEVITLSLSFSQFRGCSSVKDPNGKDLYFFTNSSSQITSDMFSFCDSTSGAPNVYFRPDSHSDSKRIPQNSQTHTIKTVGVSFVGNEATVTVETDQAIRGTLNLLLDGSNVPRLVHVVFGDPLQFSTLGTVVVSSGTKGILPYATKYTYRKSTLVPFPSPAIHSAESFLLEDWNTTELVVKGVRLGEGSYWMLVEKDGKKWNITLIRSDSTTLNGTAPLYPSTAEGRLEWATEYKVTKVMWISQDGQTEEEVTLSDTITFTTPAEPPRIESVSCSLNGKKDVVIVELSGSALSSSGQTVVMAGSSGEISSSGALFNVTSTKCCVNFSIGSTEDSTHVVFGGRYDLLSVGSDSSSCIVNSGLFVNVPHPPQITKLTPETAVTTSSFVLSVSGSNLPSGKIFTVKLTTDYTFELSFVSETAGTSTIPIGGAEEVQYGTEYTIDSIIRKETGKDDEHILLSQTKFKTPLGPTLSSISCDFDYSNPDCVKLTLTTTRMPSEVFTLTLKTTQLPILTVELPVTSDDISAGFVLVEVYKKTNTLKYGTGYSIVGMASSSVTAVVSALPFTTPPEPIRITSAECSLGGAKQKSALVTLKGVKLGGDKDFNMRVRKMEGLMPIGGEIVLSGTLSGASSSTSHTHSVVIFGLPNPLLSFKTTYLITKFNVYGSVSVVDADVTFSVPPEPARIVGIDSRQLTKDRTVMIVSLKGSALLSRTGTVSLIDASTNCESSSDVNVVDNTHCIAEFSVGEEVKPDQLKYGEEYTLKGSWTESSGFQLEDGITLVVPLPPKITKMEIIFSNSLHTGCFLTLIGTDLIVGSSLNVTLNDSLFFIATVITPTEAISLELPIGWPTTLRHNTEYTITSIEAMNEADGKIHFTSALSNTTGSLSHPFVVYVDSGSSSDSSLFCGDFDRPCFSIEDGWKIVNGVGIASFSISIICNTTQTEQVRILSHHRVVIESGPSTKPELFVSPSTKLEEEGMVDVSGGRLWIHQVDVVLSDSPSLIFIRMVEGHLSIETCSLVGPKGTPASTNIDSSTVLCAWTTGILNLVNSTTTITSTQMTRLSQGAITMKGGSLTIECGIFHDNSPLSTPFPSLRRNIRCSDGGEIEIGSLSGGDGMETPSAWLTVNDCALAAKESISRSPFFIPTLSSSSTSTLNKTSQAFDLTMEGTTLIPCSLFFEVFEKKKDGMEGQKVQIGLSEESTESFNETHIKISLPLSFMSTFEKSLEWRGRLVFGKNETTPSSFVIQKNSAERLAQAVKENMKWWIPLLISLVCLLLLIIVVVFICWRRRKQNKQRKNKTIKTEELDEDEAYRMELEQKMEETTPQKSVDHLIDLTDTRLSTHNSDPTSTSTPIEHQYVEVLGESGEVGVVDWMKADTLFDVLHRPEKKRTIEKKELSRKIVKGLIRVLGEHPTSEISTRFSPLWVLLNKNMVQLRLATIPEGQQEGEQEIPNDTQHKKEGELADSFFGGRLSAVKSRTVEGQRWRAPELCRPLGEKIDVESALVFSLGLVLWEVWTGEVPWKEMDGANAGRQNEGGVQPNLKLVLDVEVRSLVEKCLSFDPKDRPSLKEVLSVLGGTESVAPERETILPKPSDPLDLHS
ncbi:hypothetical protein BLNAU_9667 [Blattamonas nauphoetae]|uniref:Protein kinase domain-containing protein n=1 Tax=Blattamonas nauphoetae TaxID=2049346 RepID=A0ABQ9XVC6_9EUKA|nr:hypothetical protein BLNAU_9667 [Blattamonas nauphoetae]